jgi:hypothetical protein
MEKMSIFSLAKLGQHVYHRGMDHADIIKTLGGTKAVADLTGASEFAVWKWRRRGIPGAEWPSIIRRASEIGVDITLDAIEAGSPLKTRRPA